MPRLIVVPVELSNDINTDRAVQRSNAILKCKYSPYLFVASFHKPTRQVFELLFCSRQVLSPKHTCGTQVSRLIWSQGWCSSFSYSCSCWCSDRYEHGSWAFVDRPGPKKQLFLHFTWTVLYMSTTVERSAIGYSSCLSLRPLRATSLVLPLLVSLTWKRDFNELCNHRPWSHRLNWLLHLHESCLMSGNKLEISSVSRGILSSHPRTILPRIILALIQNM